MSFGLKNKQTLTTTSYNNWGLTIINDEIYVGEYTASGNKIYVYNLSGNLIRTLTTSIAYSYTIGTDGIDLYIKDSSNNIRKVDKFTGLVASDIFANISLMNSSGNFIIYKDFIISPDFSSTVNILDLRGNRIIYASVASSTSGITLFYDVENTLRLLVACYSNPNSIYISNELELVLKGAVPLTFTKVYTPSEYIVSLFYYNNKLYYTSYSNKKVITYDCYFFHNIKRNIDNVKACDNLQLGDLVPCGFRYNDINVGTFYDFGSASGPELNTTTKSGRFNWVYLGKEQGKYKFIADRTLRQLPFTTLQENRVVSSPNELKFQYDIIPEDEQITFYNRTPQYQNMIEYKGDLYLLYAYNKTLVLKRYKDGEFKTIHNSLSLTQKIDITAFTMCVYNNKLYIFWNDQDFNSEYILKVAVYDGYSVEYLPYFINYSKNRNIYSIFATVYNNELYLAWSEHNGSYYQIRVRKFDGTTWTWVDGGTSNGLNYNTSKDAYYVYLIVYNKELYVIWNENYTYVRKYNGTTWNWITNTSYGININAVSDNMPFSCVTYDNKLYIIYSEGNKLVCRYFNGLTWTTISNDLRVSTESVTKGIYTTIYKNNLYVFWSSNDYIFGKSYNGTTWTTITTQLNLKSAMHSFYVYSTNNYLYVSFTENTYFLNIKQFDNTNWILLPYVNISSKYSLNMINYNEKTYVFMIELSVYGYYVLNFYELIDNSNLKFIQTLNYTVTKNVHNLQVPAVIAHNNELYLAWSEHNGRYYQIRVRKFNGTTWTWVDGGTSNGLNYNTSKDAISPSNFVIYNNELYLAWSEHNGSYYQIRVRKFNGTTWTWVDGGTSNGLNYNISVDAYNSILYIFNNKLFVAWTERDGTYQRIKLKFYSGTWNSTTGLPVGGSHHYPGTFFEANGILYLIFRMYSTSSILIYKLNNTTWTLHRYYNCSMFTFSYTITDNKLYLYSQNYLYMFDGNYLYYVANINFSLDTDSSIPTPNKVYLDSNLNIYGLNNYRFYSLKLTSKSNETFNFMYRLPNGYSFNISEWDNIFSNSFNGNVSEFFYWPSNGWSWTSSYNSSSVIVRGSSPISITNSTTIGITSSCWWRPILILELKNSLPILTVNFDRTTSYYPEVYVTGSIEDYDNDTVDYKLVVNDTIIKDFDYFKLSPVNFNYSPILLQKGLNTINILIKDSKEALVTNKYYIKVKDLDITHVSVDNPDTNYIDVSNKLNTKNSLIVSFKYNDSLGYIYNSSLSLNCSGTSGTVKIYPITSNYNIETVTYNTKPNLDSYYELVTLNPNTLINLKSILRYMYNKGFNYGIYIESVTADLDIDTIGNNLTIDYIPTELVLPDIVYSNKVNLKFKPVKGYDTEYIELYKNQLGATSKLTTFYTYDLKYTDNNLPKTNTTVSYYIIAKHEGVLKTSDSITIPVPNPGYVNKLINNVYTLRLADGIALDSSLTDYDFYTTSDRIVLKPLDMGTIIGGRTQNIYPFEVINCYESIDFNIELFATTDNHKKAVSFGTYGILPDTDSVDTGTKVELGLASDLSDASYPLFFKLPAQQKQIVYIRIHPTIYKSIGQHTFKLKLTARPL